MAGGGVISPWTRWRDRRRIRRTLRLIDHYGLPRVDEVAANPNALAWWVAAAEAYAATAQRTDLSSVGLGSPLLDAPSARSHSRRASALPRVDAPTRDAA